MTHKQRLEQVLEVAQQYLPPDGIGAKEAMHRIVGLVDPMPEEKTIGQHRAEFELWLSSVETRGDADFERCMGDGFYMDWDVQRAWISWKAARGVTE